VSKFHLFWCHVAQQSKLRRKFLGRLDISGSITEYIHRNQTYPVKGRTCLPGSFSSNVCSLFWSYLVNRVFNWSHSFSAAFITLRGSFLCYWLVSSLYCRVVALGFKLRTYVSSCIRILIGSHSPPSGRLPRSFRKRMNPVHRWQGRKLEGKKGGYNNARGSIRTKKGCIVS
jgi:hypothetical protein